VVGGEEEEERRSVKLGPYHAEEVILDNRKWWKRCSSYPSCGHAISLQLTKHHLVCR